MLKLLRVELLRLRTVDGFVAFDLDDCRVNTGGTRLAPDVTEFGVVVAAETALGSLAGRAVAVSPRST